MSRSPDSAPHKPTAFVSHYDCSRHDTGWGHQDHQGRLPAVIRAVHADMLTLFDSLEEVEGRHATESELRLVHTSEYISRVQSWVGDAQRGAGPVEIRPELIASAATWDASLAAVGSVLRAVDVVLGGETTNAFCAIRPAARDAGIDEPGRFGFFNQVAVAARAYRYAHPSPLLVVVWGEPDAGALRKIFASDLRVRILELESVGAGLASGPGSDPTRADDDELADRTRLALERVSRDSSPGLVLLSTSFDMTPGRGENQKAEVARNFFAATRIIRSFADEACGGKLVSILEGGYSTALGTAIVAHLRALADLDPPGV